MLSAASDPRAASVLAAAYARLIQLRDAIPDENGRRMYFDNVPTHRELAAAWRAV